MCPPKTTQINLSSRLPPTGVISLSRSLHGKANTVISMAISAEDGGGLTAPVNARVNVSVVGGSVASPVFDQAQYFFTVSEDVLRGTAVGAVRAAAKTGDDVLSLFRDVFSAFVDLLLSACFWISKKPSCINNPSVHECRAVVVCRVIGKTKCLLYPLLDFAAPNSFRSFFRHQINRN